MAKKKRESSYQEGWNDAWKVLFGRKYSTKKGKSGQPKYLEDWLRVKRE